jgi:hypothetical protein
MVEIIVSKVFAQSYNIPKPLGDVSLQRIVASIIYAAFFAAGIVALIYLIIGGYGYITSAGNPEQAASAKNTILYSILGLIIILLSVLIIRYIMSAIGVQGFLV